MAFCGAYKDMNEARPWGAEELSDERLLSVMKAHKSSAFWRRLASTSNPDRVAYNRRWSSVVRREARQRGLL